MCLRTSEYQELKDLADRLISATDDDPLWLGPVRETSRALSALLGSERSAVVGPATGHWTCPVAGCQFSSVNPMDHPCPLTGCARYVAGVGRE